MQAGQLSLQFRLSIMVEFQPGDWCDVRGTRYILQQLPVIEKLGENLFNYTMPMPSYVAEISKAQFLFLGADNTLRETDFALTGKADVFLNLLVQNINRVVPGWQAGAWPQTEDKTMSFAKEDCLTALGRIAAEFGTEWYIEGQVIHLAQKTRETGHTYRQGMNRGLASLTRINAEQSRLITRLYAFGSTKNLPGNYRGYAGRLQLPGVAPPEGPLGLKDIEWVVSDTGGGMQSVAFNFAPPVDSRITALTIIYDGPRGASQSTGGNTSPRSISMPQGDWYDIRFRMQLFGGGFIETAPFRVTTGMGIGLTDPPLREPYIEQNTALYGVREGVVVFEDIFPTRTGTVTGVNANDPFEMTDITMDFDINEQRAPGLTPAVSFKSGQLTGYDLEVGSYDPVNKRFKLLKNKSESKMDVPSALLRPQIGDRYTLVNLFMPQTYIDDAEARLLAAATTDLQRLSSPQVKLQARPDAKYIKLRGRTFMPGDLIWIEDAQLGINRKIRITELTRNVVEDWSYELTLADAIGTSNATQIERIVQSGSVGRDVAGVAKELTNNAILQGIAFLPETTGGAGFKDVVVEEATGRLFRKV